MRTISLILMAATVAGCGEIVGPDHVKCTLFASGETFTAETRNMIVDGDFLYVIDDENKVRAFRMIDSDSNAYVGSCKPLDSRDDRA